MICMCIFVCVFGGRFCTDADEVRRRMVRVKERFFFLCMLWVIFSEMTGLVQ